MRIGPELPAASGVFWTGMINILGESESKVIESLAVSVSGSSVSTKDWWGVESASGYVPFMLKPKRET